MLLGKAPWPRLQGGGERILRSQEFPGEPDYPWAKLSYCLQRSRNSLSKNSLQEFLLVASGKYNATPKNEKESFKISMAAEALISLANKLLFYKITCHATGLELLQFFYTVTPWTLGCHSIITCSFSHLNLIKEEFIPDTVIPDDPTPDLGLFTLCCKFQEPAL